jgi:hypothetical protein
LQDFRDCIPLQVVLNIDVVFVRVRNDERKPGPVFIKMAQVAYDLGAEFFYRVNDDTEFIQLWATPFIQALEVSPIVRVSSYNPFHLLSSSPGVSSLLRTL